MIHVQRKGDDLYIWDYEKRNPIILDHDEAFEFAHNILNEIGKMKQEQDEEVLTDAV